MRYFLHLFVFYALLLITREEHKPETIELKVKFPGKSFKYLSIDVHHISAQLRGIQTELQCSTLPLKHVNYSQSGFSRLKQ